MLDHQLSHREVFRIAGREPCGDRDSGRGDEAIGLAQRDALRGELAPPTTRVLSFVLTERDDLKTAQQPSDRRLIGRTCAAPELLDIDRADVRGILARERPEPVGGRPPAERVDEHGRVEEQAGHLTDAAGVRPALVAHPRGGIRVPLVS